MLWEPYESWEVHRRPELDWLLLGLMETSTTSAHSGGNDTCCFAFVNVIALMISFAPVRGAI